MKILVIGNDPYIADPNSDAAKRIKEYGELVDKLTIFLLLRKNVGSGRADDGILYSQQKISIYVFSGRWSRFIKALWHGRKIIAREKPDLFDAQDIEHGLIAWIFSRVYKIPWRLQIHSDIFSSYFVQRRTSNRMRVVLAKFLIPRADCIRVVSQRIEKSLVARSKAPEAKIDILPIFVDVDQIRNTPVTVDLHQKYPRFDFIILMASRLTNEKNIEMAIEAVRDANMRLHANDTNKKVGLIIVGSGPEKKNLEFQVSRFKLQNVVKFEKEVDFKTLISYYKTANLFLLTSLYEGYGRTLIEAAATGCPVVSTDVGIALEILEKENIVEVGDVDGLANNLIRANSRIVRPVKLPYLMSKQEYLQAYKQSWQKCGKEYKSTTGRKDKNTKSKIVIVDEKDNIIGYKDRDTVKQGDIYRVSALWITNSKGDILLARRALTKSHSSGKWGPAVAGTVEDGEDYERNIHKEAEEEIGLKDINVKVGPKIRISGKHNYFGQWYLLEIDRSIEEFVVNKNEVDQIRWFSKDELLKEIEMYPDKFIRNMKQYIKLFCK